MHGRDELREQGTITWIAEEHGGAAAPEDIVDALRNDRFEPDPYTENGGES